MQALVARLGEQQRPRRRAVAARAAGLLVEGLDRARDARVGDRPHVGLVDAHPEGVRRHDDLGLAAHEARLRRRALVAAQAGVVGDDLRAQLARELRGQPLGLRPRAGVDDRRARPGLAQRGQQAAALVGRGRAAHDGEAQVGAVEARADPHGVAQAEARDDVRRHVRSSRWRSRPRSPARRASARRRPGGSSPGGSRGPTATRSGPRRRRTARCAPRGSPPGTRARRSARARRRAAAARRRSRARGPRGSATGPAAR